MDAWVVIDRKSITTRLVIPGWSILPHYFLSLFPKDNLIILNPFILDQNQWELYVKSTFINKKVRLKFQKLEQGFNLKINQVFIFSMGLQWVAQHAQELYRLPCDIVSPSTNYNAHEIDQMIINLNKSYPALLKAFYRRCFDSNSDWMWWKTNQLETHIDNNNSKILIDWLDIYGRIKVDIPDLKNINVWVDLNDKIGVKPSLNLEYTQINPIKGHILRCF
ncbi:MAG: hypothetical protein VW397_07780 [Candidatus Margulisiibacteriota bacterium]